ncbi:MAG: tetraacyldisaccharide 4'-kinase [Planctomycetes bacterium]|nr:tetraacyldisaccharide 4'-kinase [Planctomycetota bacterium]MCC7169219.1 tetraacyldisaccharide 4'-kinase [Planctomycetota bacterium]
MRGALWLASLPHSAALCVFHGLFDRGWRRPRRAPLRVVCVGNLTAGGTGKTPIVAWLALAALAAGRHPAIVLRGYRKGARDGAGSDEAQLYARLVPSVPVLVDADRVRAAHAAAALGADLVLLDDGFQHRRLHRDVDIVLLDARDPFGGGAVMPRGFLREPPTGLARADVVVLTRSDRAGADALAEAERRVRALAPQAAIVREVHAATELIGHDGSRIADVGALRGARVTCMSGIGDPTTLAESVTRCGAIVVRTLDFGDHHEFTPAELAAVARDCAADGVRWCVTTQKDAMRIGAVPAGLPLVVLRIEARFDGEAATNTMSALV